MKKVILVALCALGALCGAHEARAGACGLPDATPLWIDYTDGTVPFSTDLFGKPGLITATGGANLPPVLRQLGGQTIYWEMHFDQFVGTTVKPADPSTVDDAAQRMFDRAVARSGCATPLIALNELNGPYLTTPWSDNVALYRADVLELLRQLSSLGAKPFLLLPSAPYTGGEALGWWREAAQVSDFVPEVYFNGRALYQLGLVAASRKLREGFRQAVLNLTKLGIPSSKIGIMLGFQSRLGTLGREGLHPSSAWFDVIKLQVLAAKQVAAELKLGTIWSWGWGTFSAAGADPDKKTAACVYLWTRDPQLCDALAVAGPHFDRSLTEGQIALPNGAFCTVGDQTIKTKDITALAAVTGDSELAFTLLYERIVESAKLSIKPSEIIDAENAIVAQSFGGNRNAYLAALDQAHATLAITRAAIGDALRRARIAARLSVGPPDQSAIDAFYNSYPDTPTRLVTASPDPLWLDGRAQGIVLAVAAPPVVFSLAPGEQATVFTSEGQFTVTALEDTLPLGAVPLAVARPAIAAALSSFARADAFERWTHEHQAQAQGKTICRQDKLPAIGSFDLSALLLPETF